MRSPTRVFSALALALSALSLLAPGEARAHGADAACDAACAAGTGLLIGVPTAVVAAGLAVDVGALVLLSRPGEVPRAWPLAGLLLWAPATAGFALSTSLSAVSLATTASDRDTATLTLALSAPALALGLASLALHGRLLAAPRRPPVAAWVLPTERGFAFAMRF